MKKILYILCTMIFLVSCANDDYDTLSDKEHLVKITAIADFHSSSRTIVEDEIYVMEIYEDSNYTKLVGSQHVSTDGIFQDIPLDGTKKYYALFWAAFGKTNVYDTSNLKSVTINEGEKPVDAFAGKTTIEGIASSIDVELERVVGNVNLLEVGIIQPKRIKLQFYQPTVYNVATGSVSENKLRSENIDVINPVDGTIKNTVLNSNPIYILSYSKFHVIDFQMQITDFNDENGSDIIPISFSVISNHTSNILGNFIF